MDIYTTAIAVSILVYIVIGSYAGRGVRNLDDYYVAGRRAPTLLIVGTLVASVMSSTMFLGEAGFAYDTQAGPYVLFPQGAAVGYVLELPYQRATGILAPGGSLDWATGEMALMVSWSVIWIALGVFAIRYILRAYAPASRGPSGRAPAIFGRL
jgi:hypothetical protein